MTSLPAPPIPPVAPVKKPIQPFLVHQKYKQQQRQLKQQQPPPPSPSPSPSSAFSTALTWTVLALVTSATLSLALTDSWSWGFDLASLLPNKLVRPGGGLGGPLTLTEIQLSLYDGTVDTRPIYLAIDGDVYDVTLGRDSYGPGGAYHHFSGRDAARAFVTGCFETHLTHDLRGFTERDLETLRHWKRFYESHAKYRKVGRVMHPPIDPESPIPAPCTPASGKVDQPGAANANAASPKSNPSHGQG